MKKIVLLIVAIFFAFINVNAATNRLYFTEKDNRLYYDTDVFAEDKFMAHYDMVPGKEYIDELTIENDTNQTYELYLKIRLNEQDELAEELINNILMDVYLDDELIYSGSVRGLDYNGNGVDLQESILLGKYKPNTTSLLVVKTKLADSYSNINNTSVGKITWEFYGRYGEEITPILPETSDNIIEYMILLVGSALMLTLIIFILTKDKKECKQSKE